MITFIIYKWLHRCSSINMGIIWKMHGCKFKELSLLKKKNEQTTEPRGSIIRDVENARHSWTCKRPSQWDCSPSHLLHALCRQSTFGQTKLSDLSCHV